MKPIGIIDNEGKIIEGVMVPDAIADLPRYDMDVKTFTAGKRYVEEREAHYGKYVKVTDLVEATKKL